LPRARASSTDAAGRRPAHGRYRRRWPGRCGDPQIFKSPVRSAGSYVRHLMYRGTYKIVCTIHRGDQKMTLKVVK
jgi:hypothetical protein